MNAIQDLRLLLERRVPLISLESREELRVIELLQQANTDFPRPLFRWTVTSGLQRLDEGYKPQRFNAKPTDVLQHLVDVRQSGIYVLIDFHPYLEDPVHLRLLRDFAQKEQNTEKTIVLLSHELTIPPELSHLVFTYQLPLPSQEELMELITEIARDFVRKNGGKKVKADATTVQLLARSLAGLTLTDARALAEHAIFHDGLIDKEDIAAAIKRKYELMNGSGVLTFTFETTNFGKVGGLHQLKAWLQLRRKVFLKPGHSPNLDPPKGILLLGVQGGGKSLAAKAVAGLWELPLLRLDFGNLYDKYYGETEKNLRRALQTAELMAPCVLWIDEIEKGLSGSTEDEGLSRRMLGSLLTWMSERSAPVFLVATANDISTLPPELLRKGRFDELFFVDLPDTAIRRDIFAIHLRERQLVPEAFDLDRCARQSAGFSGAEIEQAIISALYATAAQDRPPETEDFVAALRQTRPLSVLMAEKIQGLRAWARERTVSAH
jgi:hypothetical protein